MYYRHICTCKPALIDLNVLPSLLPVFFKKEGKDYKPLPCHRPLLKLISSFSSLELTTILNIVVNIFMHDHMNFLHV